MQSTDSSPDDIRENYMMESLEQDMDIAKQITPPPSAGGVSISSPSPNSTHAEIKYQVLQSLA